MAEVEAGVVAKGEQRVEVRELVVPAAVGAANVDQVADGAPATRAGSR